MSLERFSIKDGGSDVGTGTFDALDGASAIATHTIGGSHYALVTSQNDDGVQIIDITDPASPTAVASVTDGADYPELDGAFAIATYTIGGSHYALVASFADDGVQIIDITDPENTTAVASVTDGTDYPELEGATDITTHTIGASHYALVASRTDDGVQIINITDPADPSAVASVTDDAIYPALDGAYAITTHTIGSSHYALVASFDDDGVQIINITDPSDPTAVAAITDGTAYPALDGAQGIAVHTIGSRHYALVASDALSGAADDGVQIIDITDPANPSPIGSVTDGAAYPTLSGAWGIATHTIGSRHYALVASIGDDGVQMIDITEPALPFDPLAPYLELDLVGDRRAIYADSDNTDANLVFEYTVREEDSTADLAYKATDSLKLGANGLEDAGVTLPAPGGANSLSANKEISLNRPAMLENVTSTTSDGNYSAEATIDVRLSFTEPVSLDRFTIHDGGSDAGAGTFNLLEGPEDITVHTIGNSHYALVVSSDDDGVQIIDITDPENPTAVASITDGDTYTELDSPAASPPTR